MVLLLQRDGLVFFHAHCESDDIAKTARDVAVLCSSYNLDEDCVKLMMEIRKLPFKPSCNPDASFRLPGTDSLNFFSICKVSE